jgi:hypothetical protein
MSVIVNIEECLIHISYLRVMIYVHTKSLLSSWNYSLIITIIIKPKFIYNFRAKDMLFFIIRKLTSRKLHAFRTSIMTQNFILHIKLVEALESLRYKLIKFKRKAEVQILRYTCTYACTLHEVFKRLRLKCDELTIHGHMEVIHFN